MPPSFDHGPSSQLELAFEDNKLAAQLYGDFDQHLALIEQRLSVQATPRGNHVMLKGGASAVDQARRVLESLYEQLREAGVETLYDDRDERGGVKLGSMDMIGLPWQVIVGPRGIANGTVELKRRSSGEREELSVESALARLTE